MSFFPFNHSGALFPSFLVLFYFVQLTFRFDHQAQRAYVFRVENFQFIMVSQILTKEQLEKISNENLIHLSWHYKAIYCCKKWFVTTEQSPVEKVVGNNVQNSFAGKEKWGVDKSAYSGTEHLKTFSRGFQY